MVTAVHYDEGSISSHRKLLFSLLFQPFDLLTLAFQLGFVYIDFTLLPLLFHFLVLELIADQRAGAESKHAADGRPSAGMSNRRHRRSGHLFQGRYKAILVDRDSYFLELARYIVLNPVRAAMVKHPRLWPWSSYGTTIGTSPAPTWLTTDELLAGFGRRPAAARRKYQQFVAEGMGADSIWKDLKGQIYLGDDDFVEQMRDKQGERAQDVNIPQVQQRGAAPKLSAIRQRYNNRDDAIRVAYATGSYSYQQIAKEFGVHFTTVGRLVRQPAKQVGAARGRR